MPLTQVNSDVLSTTLANIRLAASGNITFADGTILTSAAVANNFGNVNVAAYVTTNGLTNYSNVNATSLVTALGHTNFSNVNVAAYTQTQGYTNYSNVNVATYLPTHTANVGADAFVGNSVSVTGNLSITISGTSYLTINRTLAGSRIFPTSADSLLLGGTSQNAANITLQSITSSDINIYSRSTVFSVTGLTQNTSNVWIQANTAANSTVSGALRVNGGIGVVGNVWAGNMYLAASGTLIANIPNQRIMIGGANISITNDDGNLQYKHNANSIIWYKYDTIPSYTAYYKPDGISLYRGDYSAQMDIIPEKITIASGATKQFEANATTIYTVGNVRAAGNLTVGGSTDISQGVTLISTTSEEVTTNASVAGTYVINYNGGVSGNAVHYWSAITSNVTVNITNINSADGLTTTFALIINQGASPFVANVLQIGGVAQTIKWQGGTAPKGNANKLDIQSFTIMRIAGTWITAGDLSTYG